MPGTDNLDSRLILAERSKHTTKGETMKLLIAMLCAIAAYGCQLQAQAQDFGRMFPQLAPFQPPELLLTNLAASMADPNAPADDNPAGRPSIFTYLGQFLDHDLTLMTPPLDEANGDLSVISNARTPRLDLDSVYGGGLQGSPNFYDAAGRFITTINANGVEDLQRGPDGTAILIEGRNDENLIIAQIHLAFQRFHNHYVDQGYSFSEAQQLVRWRWQWIVVHDLLPEFVGQDVVDQFLVYNGAGKPNVRYQNYKPGNPNRPMTPIEFSVAAYRFGHSMIRLAYVMPTGSVTKTQVFNAAGNDLHGSRPIPPNLKIDFRNFVEIPGQPRPPGFNVFRKIDALISKSVAGAVPSTPQLGPLPTNPPVVSPADTPLVTSLPARNLLRGARIGLPSYQDVASSMGIAPLGLTTLSNPNTVPPIDFTDPAWGGGSPLWFSILKESEVLKNGQTLGPTGGRIVAEVILGLIDQDKTSYFSSPRAWTPQDGSIPGEFHVFDLLALAGSL